MKELLIAWIMNQMRSSLFDCTASFDITGLRLFSKSNLLKLYQNFNVYYLISFNGASKVPEIGSVLILANLSMLHYARFWYSSTVGI